jgi:hypothetical protein
MQCHVGRKAVWYQLIVKTGPMPNSDSGPQPTLDVLCDRLQHSNIHSRSCTTEDGPSSSTMSSVNNQEIRVDNTR